jgi:hypothetical protein
MASESDADKAFVNIFKAVNTFRETGRIESTDPLAVLELALSFEHKDKFPEIATEGFAEEVCRVLSSRQSIVTKNHLKCPKVLRASYLGQVLKKFKRMGGTEWLVPTLPEQYSYLRLLHSFASYLDKLIPVLLSGDQGSGKRVSDVLAMTPYQNLKQLLNEEKMQEAEELAGMLQQDLLHMVLEDGSYPPGVVRYLTKDFPIVGVTSVLVSQVKCDENLVTVPSACQTLFEKRIMDDLDAADGPSRPHCSATSVQSSARTSGRRPRRLPIS